MTATDKAGECKIVFDPVLICFGATIEQRLHLLPCLPVHQRLVRALVRHAVPVEIPP